MSYLVGFFCVCVWFSLVFLFCVLCLLFGCEFGVFCVGIVWCLFVCWCWWLCCCCGGRVWLGCIVLEFIFWWSRCSLVVVFVLFWFFICWVWWCCFGCSGWMCGGLCLCICRVVCCLLLWWWVGICWVVGWCWCWGDVCGWWWLCFCFLVCIGRLLFVCWVWVGLVGCGCFEIRVVMRWVVCLFWWCVMIVGICCVVCGVKILFWLVWWGRCGWWYVEFLDGLIVFVCFIWVVWYWMYLGCLMFFEGKVFV